MAFAVPYAWAENPNWAQAVKLAGVPNLHKVTDDLYRGAQPTEEGFKNLERLGIKTVINLRSFHYDDLRGTSLKSVRIRMEAWDPDFREIVRVMSILSDPSGAPYFLHCQHGADRTGMVTAVYRMAVQGWSKSDAIAEMTEGGYGFHSIWTEIPKFLRKLDVKKIKSMM
ncbi:MAG: tyrosine-protein phosphatase [Synergistaceae bacterium]|jgi:protein tyrosine/serine phosphatase|nr:tyrosine-protein phosphatase [Synergistaceae bacterium]